MSIAEKLTQVAENIPKVYAAGQSSMVDESKLIPKTVSGSYISVDDVSEIPHEVKCKISGVDNPQNVKVIRCGKNLFDVNGHNPEVANNIYRLKPNTAYTLSSNCPKFTSTASIYFNGGSSMSNGVCVDVPRTTTTDENGYLYISLRTKPTDSDPLNETYAAYTLLKSGECWIQLEEGTAATPYEPYNGQTLTPATDGTVEGMTSVSPYMNVFSDTEGVNIEATYNKSYGMQTEYDRFWDGLQDRGNRTVYQSAFQRWACPFISPKYKFTTTTMYELLTFSTVEEFDWSKVIEQPYTSAYSMCRHAQKLKSVDTTIAVNSSPSSTFWTQSFLYAYALKTIKKIITVETLTYTDTFAYCNSLENITVEGVIGNNISFKDSPLTKASITSVVNALSSTVTGKTLMLKLSAVNTAFETSAGAKDGSTSAEFAALVATKTNWTITMV